LNIDIIAVGKLKEKYLKDAIAEYSKRLSRFTNLNIIELADEKIQDNPSEKEMEQVKEAEGKAIMAKIKPDSYVISLCVEGKQMSSEKLSEKLESIMMTNSNITFIIGGSLGLADVIKVRSDLRLSFSEMTFPHQLMRVILLEQIYRGFKIMRNESYHK